ncbi:hypothetical protein GpartN1_g5490.t1 [Galdieria partita]|uniref:AAA+ ATPase domain-containing protein n=1 Tax=Galdieria partita TaxID=83374 RepID=A0A9C7Q0T5_9RHOD|nr:hypothetical protein GpartN1_g5490.t1 [Galdieria partita]
MKSDEENFNVVDDGLFQHIWPEFYLQVVNYCEIVLSRRVNSLGFSLHGPSGSGKTVFAKSIAALFSNNIHYGTGIDWVLAYGQFLASPLQNIMLSIPAERPVVLIIDDADVLLVGKKAMEKKSMCRFIEELECYRRLQQQQQRILWILITREENQLHPIFRRDEYFPHSFCIPPLSTAGIQYVISHWIEKMNDPALSKIVLDSLQHASESMFSQWNGCVLGHIADWMATFLLSYVTKSRDVKQWSLEATLALTTIQNNPTWRIKCNQPHKNFSLDYMSWSSDNIDQSILSETFNDLLTVIEYSMTQNDHVFPSTVSPYRGALIYGPCGVGKTTLCHQLVEKLHLPVFVVDGASLLASAIGQSEKTLKQCFQAARRFSPSVIFVDQIDMVFQKRDFADGTSAESLSRLTSLFLSEMDGFSTSRQPEFFVLATAQELTKIDSALLRPGRLEYKQRLDWPTSHQRYRYFCLFFKHVKNVGIIVDEELEQDAFMYCIIQSTHRWSLADLSMLFRSVLMCCLREDTNHLKRRHFETMLIQKKETSNWSLSADHSESRSRSNG